MIKNATAEYTGGGVYIIYGQMIDGNWFEFDNECYEVTIMNQSIIDADFYINDDNTIRYLDNEESKMIVLEAYNYILDNHPAGNYNDIDIERDMQEVSYED